MVARQAVSRLRAQRAYGVALSRHCIGRHAGDHRAQRAFVFECAEGFFPQQDTGRIQGSIIADQCASFQAIDERVQRIINIVKNDPAVESVLGQTGQWAGSGGAGGGSSMNTGRMSITLKPWEDRKPVTAEQVIARLRPKVSKFPGATVSMQAVQDIRVGARQAAAQYQYTLQGENLED